MTRLSATAAVVFVTLLAEATGEAVQQTYEIGGPLAGISLPLYQTRHGEPPGYPGCIPELYEKGEEVQDGSAVYREFGKQGQGPQRELSPGSVEHWRSYWFKYCPVRSLYDRQSLLQNFLAHEHPGVSAEMVEDYAEPIYWVPRHRQPVATGRTNRPVKVVRCRPDSPVLKLALGELEVGMYAVRVIGAVETRELQPIRKPLYLRMSVNDGLRGEVTVNRMRVPYVDEFYSVGEFYFHAPEERAFTAELAVDRGSLVDLLIHNIELHDALAGSTRKAVKARPTMYDPAARAKQFERVREYLAKKGEEPFTPLSKEERWERDALCWNAHPPLNRQAGNAYGRNNGYSLALAMGAGGLDQKALEDEHGRWKHVRLKYGLSTVLMKNEKLKLEYTIEDLREHKPLPAPYPFKDDGAGIYTTAEADAKPQNWTPIANNVNSRIGEYFGQILHKAGRYQRYGDEKAAREAAVMLCRYAYDFPGWQFSHCVLALVLSDPVGYGRHQLRGRVCSGRGAGIKVLARPYDYVFSCIKGNQDLADSLRRFVPWIKTPEDVIQLVDVYFVQNIAKRFMRYQYYHASVPTDLALFAALLAEPSVTDPWMQWLFTKTFLYPNSPAGVQDLLISQSDRNGCLYVGSYSYAKPSIRSVQEVDLYSKAVGGGRYNLRHPERYPKTRASYFFDLLAQTAGLHFQRVGDVPGPNKTYAHWFSSDMKMVAPDAWRETRAPAFAYIMKHVVGRTDETDEDWAAIEATAGTVKRAPWLENRSRVLPNWGGFLESGLQHDDFRFRRSAIVRIGRGWVHQHNDTLDLQLHAHGYPATIDAGQRPAYSRPADRTTRKHNVVEVDGKEWGSHSWVRALSDLHGAQYLCAESPPLHGTKLFRRQVALVDVDEGKGSKTPLGYEQVGPRPTNLPEDVVTPNSYVFDVFRVSGGSTHTYCFHAHVNDPEGPQPETNAGQVERLAAEGEIGDARAQAAAAYLRSFCNDRYFGVAPENFEVTFQMQKHRFNVTDERFRLIGSEDGFIRTAFDPAAPIKFTRLHLLGVEGASVIKGDDHCHELKYHIPHLFVQRQGEALESAFAAIIEPYAGQPFVTSAKRLRIEGNEKDARRAAAVEVLTRNGHRDLCFADGRPDKPRKIGEVEVAAEFAYLSMDAAGLRQASLTGGTLLASPQIRIDPAERERTGNVVKVDYWKKTAWLDRSWPESTRERVVEIGALPESGTEGYTTQYTVTRVRADGEKSALTFLRGADYYRSPIRSLDAAKGIVNCVIGTPHERGELTGLRRNWTATDSDAKHFWRAEVLPADYSKDIHPFRLTGAPVTAEAFGNENALRLWEYGPGDQVRQSTYATVRRLEENLFEVDLDVDTTISLKAASAKISHDRKDWTAARSEVEGGWIRIRMQLDKLDTLPIYLSIE